MKVYKAAGQNRGLAQHIKEHFSKNKMWMRAWMTLAHLTFGYYKVKDFFGSNVLMEVLQYLSFYFVPEVICLSHCVIH